MTEPIYHFVKGEGWVLQTFEVLETYMVCGTRVRLERRKPNPGELSIWHHVGEWDMKNWEYWALRNPFASFNAYEDQKRYMDYDRDWMVAIKL